MDLSAPRRPILLGSLFVFALALIVRVPSCYQSFWLDELHTAWCVWGALEEVYSRAVIGNQSPFYFIGLWFWRQLVGDGELGLRISSALALAGSSVALTVSVARWSRSFAAGMAAGLVLALESNAIFFGTELRPYAFVILFASVALGCFLILSAQKSRHQLHRYWSILIIAILLAALAQPTSLGVLVWLPVALYGAWYVRDKHQLLKVTRSDMVLGLLVVVVGIVLWQITLGDSWRQRSNWETFAEATRLAQIVEVWDWKWLLVIPLGIVFTSAIIAIGRGTISSNRDVLVSTLTLAFIAVVATCLFWGLSRANLAPLWHRRYFIAVLPVLACTCGGSIGVFEASLRPGRLASCLSLVAAALLPLGLAHQQKTLQRLPSYPVALANRGEDWRSANAWVRVNSRASDRIYLDAGLVEAKAWLEAAGADRRPRKPSAEQLEYLLFAARGPYRLSANILPTSLGPDLQPYELPAGWANLPGSNDVGSRVIVISRRPAHRVRPNSPASPVRVLSFGNVSVLVLQLQSDGKS